MNQTQKEGCVRRLSLPRLNLPVPGLPGGKGAGALRKRWGLLLR